MATDLCRFKYKLDTEHFWITSFFRFKADKVTDSLVNELEAVEYNIKEKSLQWRPATKAELKKYSQLIFS